MAGDWSRAPFLALWATEADGQGRIYVNPFTDERVPSVTSVLKEVPKGLERWSAMKVAERARDRPDIVLGDPDRVVDRLISAPTDFRNERGEVGTMIHQTIQADHEGSWQYPTLDDEQRGMMDRWYEFVEDYKVKILLNEFTVFGDGYAGTADLLIEYTDPFTGEVLTSICDAKTSAGIWETHFYQLAALKSAQDHAQRIFSEVPDPDVFTLKKRGDLPESRWMRYDNPALAADKAHVLQLREGFYKFEEVQDIPEQYGIFRAYLGVRTAKGRLKEAQK